MVTQEQRDSAYRFIHEHVALLANGRAQVMALARKMGRESLEETLRIADADDADAVLVLVETLAYLVADRAVRAARLLVGT